jgi:hypothetical protein
VDPLPEEVRRFIFQYIDDVDQLEILRLLGELPQREWTSGDMAGAIQSTPQTVVVHLQTLQSRGLLSTETREGVVYCRSHPATAELEFQLKRLLQVYRERPVTMINVVYARATEAIKSFADAFRIRKEQ